MYMKEKPSLSKHFKMDRVDLVVLFVRYISRVIHSIGKHAMYVGKFFY